MEIDPQQLPQDAALLRQIVLQLLQAVEDKDRLLERLQHQLEQLLRNRYGPKRERVDENQLFLFAAQILAAGQEEPSAPGSAEPPSGNSTAAGTGKAKRSGHGRKPLPETLERRRVVFDLEESQRQCPQCQKPMQRIGEDISERLEFVPASLQVIQEVRPKYACASGCGVAAAAKPPAPIEKGLPGAGLLAHIVVSKYGDHLPLYRQEGIFQRHGVELSRKTMSDWMRQCAELVGPLYDRMKQTVLSSKVVQTDDTPVPVLDPELTRTRTGRIWTYVGDDEHPYTVYDYTPTRSRDGPHAFLETFSGYLQADAYAGYDELYLDKDRDVTEVGCWMHARRKFYEAQSSDLMRSTVVLAYVRLLYDVEREAREQTMDSAQRLALRQAQSRPVLDDIKIYLEREQLQVLPKSPIGQAIHYALSNWDALLRYTEDGDLEIDNGGAERSMRGTAVGRKNWLFFGSDNGGRTAAVLTSFVASCKRFHIDPWLYFRDLFDRISAHPVSRLAELLPDQWLAKRRQTNHTP